MRITRQAVLAARTCAVCERTLLVGERSVRYSPDGESFLDVCPLCQDVALDYGWLKEGSPTTPVVPDSRRRRRGPLASLLQPKKPAAQPVVDEPILRRLRTEDGRDARVLAARSQLPAQLGALAARVVAFVRADERKQFRRRFQIAGSFGQ